MENKPFELPPQRTISRKAVIVTRIILGILFVVWVSGAFYLYSSVQEAEQKIVQVQKEAEQREERVRREAAYRQSAMQQQAVQNNVQNAVDAYRQ